MTSQGLPDVRGGAGGAAELDEGVKSDHSNTHDCQGAARFEKSCCYYV